ncbi:MAG: Na(+)/H(+) antiporter subunit F1 [Syntrophomonas sp.]|nr:Na(+)/H(+) antiporter subunit F1 [Syntrophomonas sp.]
MFDRLLGLALFLLAISVTILLHRIIKGPSMPDRVLALDAIGIHLIAMMAVLSISLRTSAFFEIMLLLAILSFIGTVALTKFIERGVLVEYDRNR